MYESECVRCGCVMQRGFGEENEAENHCNLLQRHFIRTE